MLHIDGRGRGIADQARLLTICTAMVALSGCAVHSADGSVEHPSVPPASSAPSAPFVSAIDYKLEPVDATVDGGVAAHPMTAVFTTAQWPKLGFFPKNDHWDWSGAQELLVTIRNDDSAGAEIGVRVDDSPAADGTNHCITGRAVISPGQTSTLLMDLRHTGDAATDSGMKNLPPLAGELASDTICNNVSGKIDVSHVVAFQVFLHQPAHPVKLAISAVRLGDTPVSSDRLTGIADKYGQYAKASWPGKVSTDTDLIAQAKAEAADLAKNASAKDRDEYGGWTAGPKLTSTGYFHSQKAGGKWWLVTPSGNPFLSFGMDEMYPKEPTFVVGRESMFVDPPKAGDPALRDEKGWKQSGQAYDFYQANMARKYGPGFMSKWTALTKQRMRSWGMNTVGNWASEDLWKTNPVPFTVQIYYPGKLAQVGTGNDYWGKMPDVFDPNFAANVDHGFAQQTASLKSNPWFVGYFVDNELSWTGNARGLEDEGIAIGALKLGQASPSKQAFVDLLIKKYGSVEKLNATWSSSVVSWDDLRGRGYDVPDAPTPAQKADLDMFVDAYARKYFTTIAASIKKYDPSHMYLGCRFAWKSAIAMRAAAASCDVISFNIYEDSIHGKGMDLAEKLDKPCLVSEFGFGSTDRGMFGGGLDQVSTQAERGAHYKVFVDGIIDSPVFVGAHWFQYEDEPLIGRVWDGENFNDGVVNVADNPYPEMVAALRSTLWPAYERRAAAK